MIHIDHIIEIECLDAYNAPSTTKFKNIVANTYTFGLQKNLD